MDPPSTRFDQVRAVSNCSGRGACRTLHRLELDVAGPDLRLDDTVCASKTQVSNHLGDEVAILELDKGVYYGLNPTGARVWDLLRSPTSVRSLLDALLADYDVDGDTARQDLLELLDSLRAHGLIEVQRGSAG
jgi:hypothetical protein